MVEKDGLAMLNFPVPYPDELIYSLVARAGIHLGLTSPKQLLDEVFANMVEFYSR